MAGKRHPSPSRIAPKALPARCFVAVSAAATRLPAAETLLSMFKRKPSPEGKLA
jgi:hypothetical protein